MNWYKIAQSKEVGKKIYIYLPDVKQQEDYTCGGACLRSIIAYYYGSSPTENEMSDLCDTGERKGTDVEDIIKASTKLGLGVKVETEMTVQKLMNYVKNKTPVICHVQAWGTPKDYEELKSGHYIIAIGYDDNNLYFEDPWIVGKRGYISKIDMEKRWHGRDLYQDEIDLELGIVFNGKRKNKEVSFSPRKIVEIL